MKRWLAVGVAVTVVLVGVSTLWARWWREQHPSGILAAAAAAPLATQRLSYTDWSQVRLQLRVLRGTEVSTMSTWLQKAFESDLSSASLIASAGPALNKHFGFSPANVQWEAYAQAPKGQVDILRTNDDTDFAAIEAALKKSGYPAPIDGIWAGGVDLLASIDPSLSAEFSNIVLLPEHDMVLLSSSTSYLATARATIEGHQKALSTLGSATAMLDSLDDPAAAVVWTRDFACADLAMSQADPQSQTEAQQAITAAGQVSPLVGFTLSLDPTGVLTVAGQFPSAKIAEGDLKARARLAVGPEFGRGGANFADDFKLESATTKNATLLLVMKPARSGVFALSSLYSGPLIFASC